MAKTTLLEEVTGWLVVQANKHGLDDDYPKNYVNEWSNWELLEHISDALGEMEKKA